MTMIETLPLKYELGEKQLLSLKESFWCDQCTKWW